MAEGVRTVLFRRARTLLPFLLLCALTLVRSASGDEYVPPKAGYRPPIGWNCWWIQTTGDFDGNGRSDRAFFWDPAEKGDRCDPSEPGPGSRVTVFLGNAGRVERRVWCAESWPLCSFRSANFDRDRRSELLVRIDQFTAVPLVVVDGELVRLQRVGPAPSAERIDFDQDVGLTFVTGYGCRTASDGARRVLTWTGDGGDREHWKIHVARWRFDGEVFHFLGRHAYRTTTDPGDVRSTPRTPDVDRCGGARAEPSDPWSLRVGRCFRSTATGDVDGDGLQDRVALFDVRRPGEECPASRFRIGVRFGSGEILDRPFPYCLPSCEMDPLDLDGDGRSELLVGVGPGAAVSYSELFRVGRSGIHPLRVAPPGDRPEVQPGPAVFGGGFDALSQSPVSCEVASDGSRSFVSWHATTEGGGAPWNVHRTVMVLEGDTLFVVERSDEVVRGERFRVPAGGPPCS